MPDLGDAEDRKAAGEEWAQPGSHFIKQITGRVQRIGLEGSEEDWGRESRSGATAEITREVLMI